MTHRIVLTSLRELEAVRDLVADGGPIPVRRALVPVIGGTGAAERGALAEAARQAVSELDQLLASDGERRAEAERGAGRVREAASETESLRRTARELGEAAQRAAALAESALERSARRRAERLAATTGRLRNQAEAHAEALEREARALAGRDDIARLLAEERRRGKEVEMRGELTLAGRHLDGGRYDEARRILSSLDGRLGSEPDLREGYESLRRRERAVHLRSAEDSLREARRLHRREPARAIDLIEAVELAGLPEEVVRHLYGCWLTACRRLGLLAAIHYRAGFGRGAVLIPTADERWEVVSALGLARWERGRTLSPRALRGARPLG
ncbi:MAG: hypothetical protein OXC94_06990 [Chloroflexi bacterium]|nr:hypothetical protein [Chloroflexota bacterium]